MEGADDPAASTSPVTRAAHAACADFLGQFKMAMQLGHFAFVRRPQYLQDLMELGLTVQNAKTIINDLTVSNCCAGPEPDDYAPAVDVWMFGYGERAKAAYIKLRLMPIANSAIVQAQVWSFHKARFTLKYPFRESR